MKRIAHISLALLCIIGLMIMGCQQQEPSPPANFRALSMIQYASGKLTIQGKNKNKNLHKTLSLAYSKAVEYQQLPPGYYDITLSVKGKKLLKKTYALGKNGYYTLLATGLLPEKWKVNPHTTMYHLKYIFAGEELESTNQYLPQWFMMRDNYDGSKNSAYIRLVNANPHTPALTVKKGHKSLKSGLGYPMESTMLKLKPGNHNLQLLYGRIKLGDKRIDAKPGYIYTAVIGNKKDSNGRLTVCMLKNPSRTLMHSK